MVSAIVTDILCRYCEVSFDSPASAVFHEVLHHVIQFECVDCGNSAANIILEHMLFHQTKEIESKPNLPRVDGDISEFSTESEEARLRVDFPPKTELKRNSPRRRGRRKRKPVLDADEWPRNDPWCLTEVQSEIETKVEEEKVELFEIIIGKQGTRFLSDDLEIVDETDIESDGNFFRASAFRPEMLETTVIEEDGVDVETDQISYDLVRDANRCIELLEAEDKAATSSRGLQLRTIQLDETPVQRNTVFKRTELDAEEMASYLDYAFDSWTTNGELYLGHDRKPSENAAAGNVMCEQCAIFFKTSGSLVVHNLTVHGSRKFSCTTCNNKFLRRSTFLQHLVRMCHGKPFRCQKYLCHMIFATREEATEHFLETHELNKCKFCGAGFKNPINRKAHEESVHGGPLKLPCPLLADDEGNSAIFDASTGDFTVRMKKQTIGEFFPNLDLLTTLKQPKVQRSNGGILEVEDLTAVMDDLLGEIPDWTVNSSECDGGENLPNLSGLSIGNKKYGFANMMSDSTEGLQEELLDICDVRSPHSKSHETRKRERIKHEQDNFDEEYYMQDAVETDTISVLLDFRTPWPQWLEKVSTSSGKLVKESVGRCRWFLGNLAHCTEIDLESSGVHWMLHRQLVDLSSRVISYNHVEASIVEYFTNYKVCYSTVEMTDGERDRMMQLANRNYLFDNADDVRRCYLGLVDILLAYAYNFRVTSGECDVESPWNISRLSATLAWFNEFDSMHEVVVTSFRRMLCYPQYRNWDLNETIRSDVVSILRLGKKAVLKCLLDILGIFNGREPYYLLNRFYINHYAVFVQRIPEGRLESLGELLQQTSVSKEDVDLGLEACDAACQLALEEETNSRRDRVSDDVKRGLKRLSLGESKVDSDDDESSSSTSSASYVMEQCCRDYDSDDAGACLCAHRAQGSVSE
ncbi:unnamed protein product [Notodromas monacha]|uniref:Protein SHQ1 homolog n=1 Tax=Notodromas monacha TaxID=399045 RepID=A0A7R9BD46_9CRUS|nr:unnamed protein product [Notodromas monacha]CAG0912568.1 unnamed protein product [Notodromas monacha]